LREVDHAILAAAPRWAAGCAYGVHVQRIGAHDDNWSDRYTNYMVREQTGESLPAWIAEAAPFPAMRWSGGVTCRCTSPSFPRNRSPSLQTSMPRRWPAC